MSRTSSILLLAALLMSCATTARTQTVAAPSLFTDTVMVTDSNVERIAYLENRLASFEARVEGGQASTVSTRCVRTACPGIIGGYDFLMLKPHFSNGIAYQTVDSVAPTTTWIQHSYSTDYDLSPRFWLGYQGPSLGMRFTYLNYDQQLAHETLSSSATRTIFFDGVTASSGQDIEFETSMLLHVLDMDVTKVFEVSRAQLTAGAGIRYAKLQYDYAGVISTNETPFITTVGRSSFEGAGPTVFVDLKAPIRQSALSVVGGLRGAVLFGTGHDETDVNRVVDPVSRTLDIEHGDRSTGTIEASLGLQYDRTLANGANAFFRVAWEGQMWMDVGSPTYAYGDMALEGISLGIGLTR